ncbi:MAG: flagellar export chaperone FliS [Betaproteobacteria bacterium]|jgi:flagellar protein FliS|uniref:Flagellar secretion chaperone FliS n=1 Tax=Candidatus Proximibacter danicus TaxID=2954365 RepID=A0A9D7K202_9PROT|nr:flagellar export chaperone FliS [Candidatus Proximibacter danicus]
MFGSQLNPLKAYQAVGLDAAVATASPYKLILMLFEGAKQALVIAKAGMEEKDIPKKGMAISKAIDIILNGLRVSLNMEEGGDLSQDLYALYDYMARRLLHANLHNDLAAIDEVSHLLGEIHSAWIEIGSQVDNPNLG